MDWRTGPYGWTISAGDLSSLFFTQFWLQARRDFCQNLLVIFNVLPVRERIAQLLNAKANLPKSRSPQHISLGASAACEFHGVDFAYPAALDQLAIWVLILTLWQVSVLLSLGQAELVNQPFSIFFCDL